MNPQHSSDLTPDPWEVEGRRLAPKLDGVCAVIVASADPRIAPRVALGLARALGAHRRVAIADLIGESPVLHGLLDGDDPHGLSDSFQYGVSLNKIARPLRGADNVFLLPSGTEPIDHDGIYGNERWRRLAAGFHQVGALLIVVARPETTGFVDLCGYIGTLLPVGDAGFPIPAGIPIISTAPVSSSTPPRPTRSRDPRRESSDDDASEPAPRRQRTRASRTRDQDDEPSGNRLRTLLAVLAVVVALIIGGVALWPRLSGLVGGSGDVRTTADSTPPAASTAAAAPTGNAASPAASDSTSASADSTAEAPSDSVASAAPPAIVNPADSATAARFAIYFATANTRAAALPDERVRKLSAVALTVVPEAGERWYRLTIGAHTTRAAADTLLTQMRRDKILSAGSILSVPLAIRLEERVPTSEVAERIAAFRDRGIMAYALRQADGSATLYTGAFETPTQATALADSLRSLSIPPVLAYRLGRAF